MHAGRGRLSGLAPESQREQTLQRGVALPDHDAMGLRSLAGELGVPFPEPAA